MGLLSMFTPCFCSDDKKTVVVKNLSTETGYDRVKRMFFADQYGLMSPELHCLINNASTGVIVAAFAGAVIYGAREKDDYLRKNIASRFESEHLAKRHLSDNITLKAFKGAFRYAAKYGSFSTLYLLSTMTIATYNNRITIWEHIGTGALLGSLARINYGIKGMSAAACLGGFLGTFTGGILVLSMKLGNFTLEELREWQTLKYYDKRRNKKEENKRLIDLPDSEHEILNEEH